MATPCNSSIPEKGEPQRALSLAAWMPPGTASSEVTREMEFGANLSAAWRAAQTNFRVGPLGCSEPADLTRPRVWREHGGFGGRPKNGLGTTGPPSKRRAGHKIPG